VHRVGFIYNMDYTCYMDIFVAVDLPHVSAQIQ